MARFAALPLPSALVACLLALAGPASASTINAVASETCRQLFLLQIYTGLRPIEIKRLRWEDYRHDCFVVQHTKTHGPIVVPIPEHLQEWYTQHERESGWVFESSRRKGQPYKNLHIVLHLASQKTGKQGDSNLPAIIHCSLP